MYYDTGNAYKSFKGKPTTNLLPSFELNGMAGITVTYIGMDGDWKKYSISGTWASGTYPYCMNVASFTFTGGTVYSTSCILKTNVLHKFEYKFSGMNYVNQPMDLGGTSYSSKNDSTQEISIGRYNFAYTSTTSQVGYLVNKPLADGTVFDSSTDFIWLKNGQIENNAFVTPYTSSSRTTTTALLDMTNTTTLTANNLTYAANNVMSFSSGSSYVAANIPDTTLMASSWTISIWVKFTTVNKGSDNMMIQHGVSTANNGLHLCERGGYAYFGMYANDTSGTIALSSGVWYNIVFVYNYNTKVKTIYINGVLDTTGGTVGYGGTGSNFMMGGGTLFGTYVYGDMPIVKMYSTVLSALAVKQNFSALRGRFGV